MGKRLDYIDRTKGILIILAVIGHVWQAGYIHNVIYSFHMPAFFVISGILMNYTGAYEKKFTKLFLKRVYAFGIPFIFFEILGILTDIIRHGITLNIKGYIFNTLMLNYNDPNLWFLVDLFLIELIFTAAKKLLKKDWAVGTFCVILFGISLVIPGRENEYIVTIIRVFRDILFFAAGFYGKDLLEKRNTVRIAASSLVPLVVAGAFGKRVDWCLTIPNMMFIVSGLMGTYAVLQLGKLRFPEKLNWILSAAGRNSIIIYGTHHIIYIAAGVLLGITDFAATPIWTGLIMLLLVAVTEAPVIYVINRWTPFLAGKRVKNGRFYIIERAI